MSTATRAAAWSRGGGAAGPWTLSDSFTGLDGTNLNGRSLEAGLAAWEVLTGAWQIQGNRCRCVTSGAADIIDLIRVPHGGTANFRSAIDVIVNGSGGITRLGGIAGRYSDALNGWNAYFGYVNGSGFLWIYEVVAGVATQRAASSLGVVPGNQTYNVAARFNGTSIQVDLNNGGAFLNYNSALTNQAVPYTGLLADRFPSYETLMDNFFSAPL